MYPSKIKRYIPSENITPYIDTNTDSSSRLDAILGLLKEYNEDNKNRFDKIQGKMELICGEMNSIYTTT